jgi:hypothetical protein
MVLFRIRAALSVHLSHVLFVDFGFEQIVVEM